MGRGLINLPCPRGRRQKALSPPATCSRSTCLMRTTTDRQAPRALDFSSCAQATSPWKRCKQHTIRGRIHQANAWLAEALGCTWKGCVSSTYPKHQTLFFLQFIMATICSMELLPASGNATWYIRGSSSSSSSPTCEPATLNAGKMKPVCS